MNFIYPHTAEGLITAKKVRHLFVLEHPSLASQIVVAPNHFKDAAAYYLKIEKDYIFNLQVALDGEYIYRYLSFYEHPVKEVRLCRVEYINGLIGVSSLTSYIEKNNITFLPHV